MYKGYVFLLIVALSSPLTARDYVTVVGSTAIYPFMTAIVEHFYYDEHQHAPIVESTGTGGGIRAFCAGLGDNQPDMVVAARKMTPSEREYCKKHDIVDPWEFEIGFDAVVLVTYGNPFAISLEELRQALSQCIQCWSDINPSLPAVKIAIMGPPTTSGVFDTFSNIVLKSKHLKLRQDNAYIQVIGHERVVVKKLELNRKILGLLSYTFLTQLPEHLKALPIDGVLPSNVTIVSGQYPLGRKSYLYVKQARISQVKSLEPFLTYIFSDSVSGPQGYLIKYGFIPLTPQAHREQQQKLMRLLEKYRLESIR